MNRIHLLCLDFEYIAKCIEGKVTLWLADDMIQTNDIATERKMYLILPNSIG